MEIQVDAYKQQQDVVLKGSILLCILVIKFLKILST
jgi:hypothetical protein